MVKFKKSIHTARVLESTSPTTPGKTTTCTHPLPSSPGSKPISLTHQIWETNSSLFPLNGIWHELKKWSNHGCPGTTKDLCKVTIGTDGKIVVTSLSCNGGPVINLYGCCKSCKAMASDNAMIRTIAKYAYKIDLAKAAFLCANSSAGDLAIFKEKMLSRNCKITGLVSQRGREGWSYFTSYEYRTINTA